ncbi:OmpA family protein (plasmid) [Sulfitobacter sp. S223]|uniref:OmpA family protein n=1 Tax=Sulfitobacter sp. S223 TaxID=2867023 RepID=UPI0021A50099|nr:OmpA family protein [Sulfitobacter sp. S223]UWR28243.1 OmpA family protein [Sulfitobacter sp. S223]
MRFIIPVVFTCIGLLSTPLSAQEDLSVEELTQLFQRQKEAFSEATSNGLGQTRGLKLVTVNDAPEAQSAATVTAQSDPSASDPEPANPIDPNKPIAATPVVFGQLDPELQVNLRITFGFDSAALAESEKPKLDKMCQVLKQSDINLVRIVGHTDTSGSAEYNERLSTLRAQEVARHLTDSCGISASRLQTIGMGERFPSNKEDSRADENRRVEFQALS